MRRKNCVAKIIIDGQAQLDKDSWFVEDSEVTIYYYVHLK